MARKPMATGTGGTSPRTTETIEHYLAQQQEQDLLRFITCGSVDDGKSTLIGRLLWDAQQLTDDQLATLKTESKKHGTQGDGIDFALLVDGLSAEREQGITIDVAYRFFATRTRKFIVADTPGHEQYTRNMVTGASTADLAVILVDARQGVLTQTRRHAYLVSLMGIRHVVLAVNKMDLQGFDASVFQRICEDFETFASGLGFASITPIPLSALRGDNITQRSMNTPWYAGPTLLGCLETIEVAKPLSERLVFPVQWVNRPDATFRGFSGYLSEGRVRVGDEIRVTRSGQTARIAEIVSMDGSLQQAVCGDAVTLRLDKEIDASRGDILSLSQNPLESTDQFEATLVWMDEAPGLIGRNYDIKLATQWASASITGIKHRVDINTLSHEASTQLGLNDISLCTLAISKPLVFDRYQHSPTLGGFILVDRMSNATVAAGTDGQPRAARTAQRPQGQGDLVHRALRIRQIDHRQCAGSGAAWARLPDLHPRWRQRSPRAEQGSWLHRCGSGGEHPAYCRSGQTDAGRRTDRDDCLHFAVHPRAADGAGPDRRGQFCRGVCQHVAGSLRATGRQRALQEGPQWPAAQPLGDWQPLRSANRAGSADH